MRQVLPQGFRLDDKAQYALDFRIIDGDVGLPHNSFHTEPLPHGCLCVYPASRGWSTSARASRRPCWPTWSRRTGCPSTACPWSWCLRGPGDFLREEGINRAKSLQCPFVDDGGGLDPVRLEQALCALVESIERLTSTRRCPRSRGPGWTCG
ncbi:hypothetical protein HPB48_005286 [Haemaphysalis longicornis]|uniref:Rho GTPase-activating protein pG1 and pG2 domain-containing protein n=1 Tax=Haemaphysalis longicornis TaxID=44386 RepID=A0A9J6H2V7_HAELO|nr:hypothetical protein HPB48_005286 [Haemaphysalis longicornis]